MRTTEHWLWQVPNTLLDPDEVPTHIGNLADQIEADVSKFSSGVWPLPSTGLKDRWYYYINASSGTYPRTLWRCNGTTWERVTPSPGADSDIVTQGWGDSPSIGDITSGLFAPPNHRHGMPGNPVTPHAAATDPHPQYAFDTDLKAVKLTIPFFIANGIVTGLKKPKWIAPAPCVIQSAVAQLDQGTGSKFRVYVNGASPTGMADSPAASGQAVFTHDFPDIALAAQDRVQVNVVTAGTSSPADLSVTVFGYWTT